MAISFRAAANVFNDAVSATTTCPLPVGVVDGDLMVALFVSAETVAGAALTVQPAGWTVVRAHTTNGTMSTAIYYRFKQPGDTAPSWTLGATRDVQVAVVAYAGVDAAPIDVSGFATRSGSGTTTTAPAVTTTDRVRRVLRLFGEKSSTTTVITPPAGVTQRVLSYGAGGATSSLLWCDVVQETAEASGTAVATYNVASANGFAATIALTPAPTRDKYEIAFSSSPNVDPASATWTDVTGYALTGGDGDPTTLSSGRQDEFGAVQPSQLTLTLDNTDDRFTPANAASPYSPNIKPARLIRYSVISGGTTYRRFTGYINDWELEWAQAGAHKVIQVTASDRKKRNARTRKFRTLLEEEVLNSGPVAYLPLSDPDGTLAPRNIATTGQPDGDLERFDLQTSTPYTLGKIEFAKESGPPASRLKAPLLTPTPIPGSPTALASFAYPTHELSPGILYGPTAAAPVSIEMWFDSRAIYSNFNPYLFFAGSSNFSLFLEHLGGSAGLKATVRDEPTTGSATVATSISLSTLYHVIVVAKPGSTLKMWVNGVQKVGTTCPTFGGAKSYLQAYIGYGISGMVSHYAAYNKELTQTDVDRHYRAGLDGWAGEPSSDRITRYTRLAGIPSSLVSVEPGLTAVADIDASGKRVDVLLDAVTDAEGGLLFVDGAGVLTFQSRGHRYNRPTVLTLGEGDIQHPLRFRIDEDGVLNDVEITGDTGLPIRITDTGSVSEYGTFSDSKTFPFGSDADSLARAQFLVNAYKDPRVRSSAIIVSLLHRPLIEAALLGLKFGDKIVISGLSGTAPAANLIVEGMREERGVDVHRLTLNASPELFPGQAFWQLDDPVNSVLDTTTIPAY